MINPNKKIELLAPAKDKNAAIIAINCGADAVYIGYLKFGARSAAGNSLEDIKEIVDYAHIFRVKVYVTINTILKNDELDDAVELINQLYVINVDGIIIQDMGLLECDLPPIPIIASTQCHNNTLEKIQFLEKTGFKRVILPREFSLDEIKSISNNTNIELESFIHGALCVSYSGQCYLSYAIGGRSANRGECAQPCRKKYSLKDSKGNFIAKDKYLLSLKDFNLSEHVKYLILAGITSFKIEGRLKDESYIKNVVSFYRQKIDEVLKELNLEKSSIGNSIIDFVPNLNKTFNRGYTNYFINGRTEDICAMDYSKSIGEFIGTVTSVKDNAFTLDKGSLNNGDGICFLNSKNELKGTNVNKVEEKLVYPKSIDEIKKGTKIYRNYDIKFISKLESSKIQRKIPVSIIIKDDKTDIIFNISDEEGINTELKNKNIYDKAKNNETALDNFKKQMAKLGDTEFSLKEININLKQIPFIPVSELNSIRRELIELFRVKRQEGYIKEIRQNDLGFTNYPVKKLDYKANIYNKKSKLFYKKRGVNEIELAAEYSKDLAGKTVMTTKYCLKHVFFLCPKNKPQNDYQNPFFLVDEFNKEYKLEFDCKNCVMNIEF